MHFEYSCCILKMNLSETGLNLSIDAQIQHYYLTHYFFLYTKIFSSVRKSFEHKSLFNAGLTHFHLFGIFAKVSSWWFSWFELQVAEKLELYPLCLRLHTLLFSEFQKKMTSERSIHSFIYGLWQFLSVNLKTK